MKSKIKELTVFISGSVILLMNFFSSYTVKLNNSGSERFMGYGEAAVASTQSITETIKYARKEISVVQVPNGVPFYRPNANLSNSCGATSGAIIVGYYDKYYEELIPNYTTYISSGKYKNNDKVYVPNLMKTLYGLMKTNVDDIGVSKADCLKGLTDYINNRGRTVAYMNVMESNKINEESYIKAVNEKMPLILFWQIVK